MAHVIENFCEPSKLVLTWQAPDLKGERRRFGVADLVKDGEDARLVYREDEDVAEAAKLGYSGYPAFRLQRQSHEGALQSFVRRLPPRDRSDFGRYLNLFRLPQRDFSDFTLLGYTEAKLPTDGFALVSELSEACLPSDHFMEIAGFRHYLQNSDGIALSNQLQIEAEPQNAFDPNAVVVRWEGKKIGNVNRFQAPTFLRWLQLGRINACFERRNGTPDRPRSYMFVEVRPAREN